MAYAAAMKDFFGLKEGQTLSGFMIELKALSEKDKADFREMLVKQAGYELTN